MAYRKNYRKKYVRPGYKSCGKMVYGDAKKALSIACGVKRLLNIEIKNFDVQPGTASVTDTPVIIQLSNIPQGDTTASRDGSQCKMVGIEVRYVISRNASADQSHCRVMLVVDRQTNQAIYTAADLLEDVTALDNISTPRNLDNKHRFIILYDKVHTFTSAFSAVHVVKYFKKEVLLRYDASTPSIADLTQNSLSWLQVGSEATNDPTINAFFRLRFIDN